MDFFPLLISNHSGNFMNMKDLQMIKSAQSPISSPSVSRAQGQGRRRVGRRVQDGKRAAEPSMQFCESQHRRRLGCQKGCDTCRQPTYLQRAVKMVFLYVCECVLWSAHGCSMFQGEVSYTRAGTVSALLPGIS